MDAKTRKDLNLEQKVQVIKLLIPLVVFTCISNSRANDCKISVLD